METITAIVFAMFVGLILILCRDGVKINIRVNHTHKHEYKNEVSALPTQTEVTQQTAEEYQKAAEKYNAEATEALGTMIRSINETMGVTYEDPNGND